MSGVWGVPEVGCSRCGMFGMWDARDVECLGCDMWDVRCWIFVGMWDVDLQNVFENEPSLILLL